MRSAIHIGNRLHIGDSRWGCTHPETTVTCSQYCGIVVLPITRKVTNAAYKAIVRVCAPRITINGPARSASCHNFNDSSAMAR